jgi:putative SOS response-associated peptidase YedK
MHVRLKSGLPFGFAGLYDTWKSPEGEALTSCTIITTEPNELVKPIHNRMPAIIPRGEYQEWLDPANEDLLALMAMLGPYPAEELVAFPVSKTVNSPQNNSPDLIEPVAEE